MLHVYEAGLLDISVKIANQKALEQYQQSIGASRDTLETGRAFTHRKIVRIVTEVLDRQPLHRASFS